MDSNPIDTKLQAVNAKLRRRKVPLRIERRGGWLWGRGTLPPKPHINKKKPYQQRFSLRQPATIDGVKVEQRADDGFINGTAMCSAHDRDISDWLKTDDVWEIVTALANDLGIEFKTDKNPNSVKTRVSATFPSLVRVKRGSPSNGGGTWVHPDLGV